MMIVSPLQNLWGFISSRPPLVVFSICIVMFAVTTFSLAYYVRNQDIRNPDIKLDWNIFLDKLSQQKLCLPANYSIPDKPSHEGHHFNHSTEELGPISFLVNVSFISSGDLSSLTGYSLVSSELGNEQLLLPSDNSGRISYHLDLPAEVNITGCKSLESCEPHLTLCATFYGSSKLLPATKTGPTCPKGDNEAKLQLLSKCSDGLDLQMKFLKNPEMTTMLTMQDHSIIDLHLMHTTYFLLAMVLMLVLYATIRGRPRVKMTLSDKALLAGQI